MTRLLLCSSDTGKLEPLRQRFNAASIKVDCATGAEQACELMWQQHYDGVAIDLLLADRDGISFALELRQEHPWLPVLVISTTQRDQRPDTGTDWLVRSSDYARLIFALKQAGQRSAGRAPRILHVEDDDALASLVQNTIGRQTCLFRARSAQEARIAMALRDYDLAVGYRERRADGRWRGWTSSLANRARNRWLGGNHNCTTVTGFYGAKQEIAHKQAFESVSLNYI